MEIVKKISREYKTNLNGFWNFRIYLTKQLRLFYLFERRQKSDRRVKNKNVPSVDLKINESCKDVARIRFKGKRLKADFLS